MKIKVIYRKNLKMSPGKLAAQTIHAAMGLANPRPDIVVVLGVSCKKFWELVDEKDCYIHRDLGLTEVEAGEVTAAAWVDRE